jgi:DNA-binding CsgD family transcriptional regulator
MTVTRSKLTPRETEVLRWMVSGGTNKEIAAQLGIATETVKEHVQQILKKLEAKNRAHAAAMEATEIEREACAKLAQRLSPELATAIRQRKTKC